MVVQLCINKEMFIFLNCSHYFVHPLHVYRYTCIGTMRMDRERDSIADMYKSVYVCEALLHIQGVPGGKDLTSGECSLGQTIPI